MATPKRSAEEIIVLALCAISAAGLLPFAILRASLGNWPVAAIDAVGFIGTATLFGFVFWSRKVGLAGAILAVLALAGMVLNVYFLGVRDLYFLYPIVMLLYFLVAPMPALAISAIALSLLTLILLPQLGPFEFAKFALSMLGCMLFAYVFASQRNKQRDLLLRQSTIDPLTGAGNRRALQDKIEELISHHERTGTTMSLIILDLDNFKQINDRDGHIVGDEVLKQISETVRNRIRVTDSFFRYGGDEFVVLATRANAAIAERIANDLRQLVVDRVDASRLRASISLGVAEYHSGESPEHWLSRADEALFDAKQSGRNMVVVNAYVAVNV